MNNVATLEIKGLRLYGYHGVYEQETLVGNTFEIDLSLSFHAIHAMMSDSVAQTINYADIIEHVKMVMEEPCKLLEHFVSKLYDDLTASYPQINSGKISVYKLQPPISVEVEKVGFTYQW